MINVLNQHISERFAAYHGDCCETIKAVPDNSVDYILYSPPFSSLYVYSNSERDLGNSHSFSEFAQHFAYLAKELYRVLKPGRLMSFHCMDLPTSKQFHGSIGLHDFPGDLLRLFQSCNLSIDEMLQLRSADPMHVNGFIWHSKVTIFKDPVTAMQRTKALGLLYKQIKKDSAMSRQGIPDYLVTMRKPGVNPDPVTKDPDEFPVDLWQRYASPVWFDINPSNTLQKGSAREHEDERHICPLQLEVIERAVRLWTNPDDLVLSPFMGIGSEGYVSLQLGRRFLGIELKASYYRQAVANLQNAEQLAGQPAMFDMFDTEEAEVSF